MTNVTTNPNAFFRQRVLSITAHWQAVVDQGAADTATLDAEREQIMRAILFGLRETAAWPTVLALIEALAAYMERTGRWAAWQTVLEQALAAARHLGDLAGVAKLSALQARLFQRQSRFKAAIAAYRRTIRLARRVGDEFSEARACSNLGYFYVDYGRWYRAEVLCCYALSIFERLENYHGQAHTNNHLGFLYLRQGRWNLSRQYLERACMIWETIEDTHGLMRGYINLGLLHNDMKKPNEALFYLHKAIYQSRLTREEIEIARIYNNLAIAHRLNGEPIKAEEKAWHAKKIFERFGDIIGLAETQDNLGLACLDQKKWLEAETHLISALSYWRFLNNEFGVIRNLTYFVDYEIARGDESKAAIRLNELKRRIDDGHEVLTEGQMKKLLHYLASI